MNVKLHSHLKPKLEQNLGFLLNQHDLPHRPNLIKGLRFSESTPEYDRLFVPTRDVTSKNEQELNHLQEQREYFFCDASFHMINKKIHPTITLLQLNSKTGHHTTLNPQGIKGFGRNYSSCGSKNSVRGHLGGSVS